MTRKPVKFENPPVVEVICGVLYKELPKLRLPHLGVFWSTVRDAFPQPDEKPPLAPVIESFPPVLGASQAMEWIDLPAPRLWLLSADGRQLLQLQKDRFLYNWKREASDDGNYPSFDKIFVEFEKWYSKFSDFVREQQLGDIEARQFELTYVNHITHANGLNVVNQSRAFVDMLRSDSGNRFLPAPETINWRTTYSMPREQGRLHMSAFTGLVGGSPILRIDLTARGISVERNDASRREWFALGHEWITHGFVDATSPELHQIWGRKQ